MLTGTQAAFQAAELGELSTVKNLISSGSFNVNTRDSDGLTALHIAAMNGQIDMVECLVKECKADVNSATSDGLTTLYVALKKGHVDVVQCLLRHGAKELSDEKYKTLNENERAVYEGVVAAQNRGKFLHFALGRYERAGAKSAVQALYVDDVVGVIYDQLMSSRPGM